LPRIASAVPPATALALHDVTARFGDCLDDIITILLLKKFSAMVLPSLFTY
jgi:hypothetical protein